MCADARNEMRIAQEEILGPVVAMIPYEDEADAVRLANDSRYGLSGSVWTGHYARGLAIARKVKTGTYTVGGYFLDFARPFGRYNGSGLGREFGPEGLDAFFEHKSVAMPYDHEPPTGSNRRNSAVSASGAPWPWRRPESSRRPTL